ncbi:MAG TPA: BlaI/MecI/CopY family transcriptional regulator [Bryobacteraceae bacterium]|jgi:predicted transcriptional regulator|nr:BlaI/MecI/CopY family transcriptional regulator [Bryobacteraceae bacterium]
MRRAKPVLTDQELEIMKVIWELGAATVRDVYEALLDRRKIAYTTVMTMMKILEQKGHLRRKLDDRAYVYQPTRPKQQVVRSMVREFVDRVFNGSAQPLLLHLLEDQNLTPKDLDEIARMIPKGAPSRKGDKKPQ